MDRNRAVNTSLALSAVALRKESVDRNLKNDKQRLDRMGRSPQGERGYGMV